ncbi:hypothetical protein [uncultured Apibacter sp.]|uniref:hypothetical protein n=1 Tax=uncultured Apibacter sp. TaxID=1778616 RepID=UPI0025E66FC1|nr:hypothetical protein [uncultured Apibacter sp.]
MSTATETKPLPPEENKLPDKSLSDSYTVNPNQIVYDKQHQSDFAINVSDVYFARKAKIPEKSDMGYIKIDTANLGDKVYLVVKCYGRPRKGKLSISIWENPQSPYNGIYNDKPLVFLVKGVEKTEIEFIIDGSIIYAQEIELRPKSNKDFEELQKKFGRIKTKNTFLYIKAKVKETTALAITFKNIFSGNFDATDNSTYYNFLTGCKEKFNIKFEILVAPWMEIVHKEEGVNERDKPYGYNRVKEYYKNGAGQNLDPIKTAWCSSFANWALVETNKVKNTNYSFIPRNSNINNPALAINFVNRQRYPGSTIISSNEKPPYGSILIIKKQNSSEGHATFVVNYTVESDGFTIIGLGGNQDNKVQKNSYKFKKVGKKYVHTTKAGTRLDHLGYVVPKEYIFNKDIQDYYEYENATATEGDSTR